MESRADNIRSQVRDRFGRLAVDPASERRFEIGRTSAIKLGYDASAITSLPATAIDAFAGVGNPLALAPLEPGLTVLDLGCGSGVDTLLAAERVGHAGKVIAIDMTEDMIDRTRRACAERGASNVEVRQCAAETLDLPDACVDIVISNGVINLCPDKRSVLAEVHRVLKPGGRLQLADMSLVEGVNPELLDRIGEWSD